jgi:hypothetical protein
MSGMMDAAERLARLFHETHERLAPTFFYATRTQTELRVPLDELPQSNRALMIATAKQILDTNQLDSVPLLKEAHRTTWRGKDQHYWFARLVQEVGELGSALVGDHHHSPDEELAEIISICLNWQEMRAQIAVYDAAEQTEAARCPSPDER